MIYVWEARGTNENEFFTASANRLEDAATRASKGARYDAHGAHCASVVGLCEEPRREEEIGLRGGEEMEIIIKGEAKEIATPLREIAERQEDKEAVVEGIS